MNIYESKHYKRLIIISLVIGLISMFFAIQVPFGIDLKGGILITSPLNDDNLNTLQLAHDIQQKFDVDELSVRKTQGLAPGLHVEFGGENTLLKAEKLLKQEQYQQVIDLLKPTTSGVVETPNLKETAESYFGKARANFKNSIITFISQKINVPSDKFSVQDIGPSLGDMFWKQAMNAMFFAFVLVSLLVFVFFRQLMVAVAIIQAAFFDVLFGLGAMGLFGIPLSLATMAPLLMLVGYSVDTDIMLTERVLKRKTSTAAKRAFSAMSTGLTMTSTTAAAMISLYVISSMVGITTLANISIILLFGLVGDIIATWFTNAPIVLWIHEKTKSKRK